MRHYATCCDKLRQDSCDIYRHIATATRTLRFTLEFLESLHFFNSLQFSEYFLVKMSSIARKNWEKHLVQDMETILHLTCDFVLRRVMERSQKRIEISRKRRRTVWVKPWLSRRFQLGAYDTLMIELANEDIDGYIAFQRLAPDLFEEILGKVGPLIQKQDTHMRLSISPGARLEITLRYLATGK